MVFIFYNKSQKQNTQKWHLKMENLVQTMNSFPNIAPYIRNHRREDAAMETAYQKWEKRRQERTGGHRPALSHRRKKGSVALGPREKRRMAQLAVCLALFLVVFIGKGVFPGKLAEVRETVLSAIQADTDFKAAFASLGRSISEGEPILDTLGDLWVEVFGGEAVTVPDGEGQVSTPLFRAQAAFLSGFPAREDAVSHWLGEAGKPEPVAVEPAEPNTVPEPTPVPTATPEPAVVHVEYNGPTLPDNATMDRYNLNALGVGETVTPALGWVSSDFGWREHPVDGGEKFHNGVDLAVNDGTDVLAFADGTVDYIGDSPIYGLYLQLSHPGGLKSFYAHCSELLVQQGQTVAAGERVALSGATGNSTGPHLHFELKLNGVLLNPLYYIETN